MTAQRLGSPAQVTAANPAVPLSATALPTVTGVTVTALLANSATVYVGGSGVDASSGTELGPGDSVPLDIDDASKVYVFCATAGQKVSVLVQ